MIRWDKVRTVAIFELTSAIRRTGFLVVTFGMPLFMAAYGAIVAVPAYYAGKRDRARPSVFGVVDRPQLLHLHADTSPPKGEIDSDAKRLLEQTGQSGAVDRMLPRSSFVFRPFAGEAEARASLARRDLRGYFVLTDDYVQTGIVEAYATDGFNVSQSDARNAFGVLVRQELLRGQVAPGIAARVTTPLPDVRRFAVSRNGELKDGGEAASVVRFALPVAFTVLFLMSVLMTSGYLLQGTATEKENKVVEVLLASANPDEILAGKLAGLCATGLVQVGVWISMLFLTGFGAVPLLFAAHVDLPWRALLVALPLFIVAFLFFGSLMLGIGVARVEHARGAAAVDGVVADGRAAPDAPERADPRAPRPRRTHSHVAAAHGRTRGRDARQHGRRLSCVVGDGRSAARAPGCDVDRDSHRRQAVQGRAPELRGEAESARGYAAGEAGGSVNRDGARGSALDARKPQSSIGIPLRQQQSRSSDEGPGFTKGPRPRSRGFRTPERRTSALFHQGRMPVMRGLLVGVREADQR